MKSQETPKQVADDVVVSLDYTLKVDGEVIDSSEDSGPIEFIQGKGQIIPGLERELYGMNSGETKHVVVTAKDGYGELDPEAVKDIPRSEFPPDIPLKPGVELEVRDLDGDVMLARIVKVDKGSVRLDFNHPLAGKSLAFDVTVVELRQPTEDELAHGHVHGDEDDEDLDEEFEFDEDEFEDDLDEDELDDEDLEDDFEDDEDFEEDEDFEDDEPRRK